MDEKNHLTMRDYSNEIQERAVKNIQYLYRNGNISQTDIARYFKSKGITVNQGTISKYIHKDASIPLGFISHLGEIFKIPLEKILCCDLEAEEALDTELEAWQDDTNVVLRLSEQTFDTKCSSHELRHMLGTYHCYIFPTKQYSAEYFCGSFDITKGEDNDCLIKMSVELKPDNNEESIIRSYVGSLMYSKGMKSYYCVIKNEDHGELVFMIFRADSQPNSTPLQSAMVSVVTVGLGRNNFAPIQHRMLLSREELKPDDMPQILPFMRLTSSEILIRVSAVEACEKEIFEKFRIENIIKSIVPDLNEFHFKSNSFCVKIPEQSLIYVISSRFYGDEYEKLYPQILSVVRKHSDTDKVNKASTQLEKNLFKLLRSLGYFKNTFN